MAEILIATPSPTGHVGPMLSISHDLVARGNRVTVITGAVNAEAVRATGAELHPLPANADLDDAQFDPVARGNTSAIAALNPAIIRMYLAPMARQPPNCPPRWPEGGSTPSSSTRHSSEWSRSWSAIAPVVHRCCTTRRHR